MSTKVAVVTGANKGIGYAIVEGLCKKFNGKVYLTARNSKRGQEAVRKLKQSGYNPSFHQLDVNDQTSVDKFRDYIENTYGGVDLLINNAGIYLNSSSAYADAERTINTNYYGLLRVSEAFLPLLRKDARVVNVSSMLGHLSRISSADLREKLSDSSLTVEKLNELMNQFLADEKNNAASQKGWSTAYDVSKVGVSALTRIHQKIVDEKYPEKNISINSVHPGYVATDLTAHRGILTPEQGAIAPLFLALEAKNLKGQFVWNDKRVVEWTSASLP